MDVRELDAELLRLQGATDRIGANLLGIEQEPTVALLDAATLVGESAVTWAAARADIGWLFQSLSSLRVVVDRAQALRGTSRTISATRSAELVDLLSGPSIVLSDAPRSIGERELLASSRKVVRCTPDELLTRMEQRFDEITRVVVAVQRTWDEQPAHVRSTRVTLSTVAEHAARVGGTPVPWLADIERELDTIAATILSDPLSFDPLSLQLIGDRLRAAATELAAASKLHESWNEQISSARVRLDEVQEGRRNCLRSIDDTAGKVTGATVAARDAATIDWDAAGALDRIVQMAGACDWAAAAADLGDWWERTTQILERAKEIVAANAALIDQRDELRSRLAAFHAKAHRLGRGEESEAAAIHEQAHSVLYTAPTNLRLAAGLVVRYQHAVSTTTASRPESKR